MIVYDTVQNKQRIVSMRIISVNVSGRGAAHRKGFWKWLEKEKAEVVCIQEAKEKGGQ